MGHDFSKLSKEVGNIIQVWQDESMELFNVENSHYQSVCMKGMLHNYLLFMAHLMDEDALQDMYDMIQIPVRYSAEQCGGWIEKIAKCYNTSSRKYGGGAAQEAFIGILDGCGQWLQQASPHVVDLFPESFVGQHKPLPLFKLGTYVHSIFLYSNAPINDKMVDHLVDFVFKYLSDTHDYVATDIDNDSPLPLPSPLPSPSHTSLVTERQEPVRAHDKAPREQKWSGNRVRNHSIQRALNNLASHRHRSEEGKAESIAAGHARRRKLKEAEQARLDELIEMQKKINIGREIGGH